MGLLVDVGAVMLAFFLSLVPVLIWLAFWLYEDSKNPEPRRVIVLAFVAGMAAVFVVLPLQAYAASMLPMGFLLILLWAASEELAKLFLTWIVVLRRSVVDEPIDMPVYLITAALGFASVENTFFLIRPVTDGQLLGSFVTGDLRFIGATLIHVLASSVIGGAFALVYYSERTQKWIYGTAGVILAIFLHAVFNSLILLKGAGNILTVFMLVWVGIVFLLLALERVKKVERPQWWEKIFMKRNA